jgi:mannose-6-phosphate isomerase-like protein (cupin superfamily)
VKLSDIKKLTRHLPTGESRTETIRRNAILRSMGYEPGALYQELEMDSRFVDTYRDAITKPSPVNLHSHRFYEILYCRSSGNVEYLVGADRYRLQKGDVVVIPPGVSHRPLFPEEMTEPYIRDVLWVSQAFVEDLMQSFPDLLRAPQEYTALLQLEENSREYVAWLFEQGVRESRRGSEEQELALVGNTILLLVQLRRSRIKNEALPVKAEKPGRLAQVL